jgi:hypothetical protein
LQLRRRSSAPCTLGLTLRLPQLLAGRGEFAFQPLQIAFEAPDLLLDRLDPLGRLRRRHGRRKGNGQGQNRGASTAPDANAATVRHGVSPRYGLA